MSSLQLVCFDMAGTTMIDSGLVLEAFRRTIDELGVVGEEAQEAEQYVVATMGQSKIEVFTALFDSRGEIANEAFERHFVEAAHEFGVREIPGVRKVVTELRRLGFDVALTTGFSQSTREALVHELEWSDLFRVRVSPQDAGRGRPAPDMLLQCLIRLEGYDTKSLVVVGDTASDMQAGKRAGAGLCVGVLTGTDSSARLVENGADVVIDSVADLMTLGAFRNVGNS
jgi:phosphonatase-like hydrolase